MGKKNIAAVVLDNGSGSCKGGLAGYSSPVSIISSVVGRPHLKSSILGADHKNYYVGKEAQARRGVLSLTYPMEHGVVTSWDDMEKVWRYMYKYEMQIKSRERPVLVTEAPFNPVQHRETMTEILFEHFRVPAMYVAVEAKLALYAAGRTNGIVLNSGDGVTYAVPVYKGECLLYPECRLDVAGRDITEYLRMLLMETGHSFASSAEKEIVKDLKEKLCYVALNPEQEMRAEQALKEYKLPDDNTIRIGSQLFRAPEILFNPASNGSDAPGVHEMLLNSIAKCSWYVRRRLYGNILLSGGSTLFHGFDERILKEMRRQVPSSCKVTIIAPPDREFCVWIGGSVLASLSQFRRMWVTSKEYEEVGPTVTDRKCG
ncbi:actin-1-like [Bombina bombina]|uniref:actin-1-like n=1 Tax=Bombina bombina TaxID=8345 RepID=UPI00235B2AF0|nr:actin-1-like [Bombina bombina]